MSGGVNREGWHAMGVGRDKLLREGKAGHAVIQKLDIGADSNDCTLEVHVDGSAPYIVQGLFSIPGNVADGVSPGMTVPVKVHPQKPKRVAIDWDAWQVDGGEGGFRASGG